MTPVEALTIARERLRQGEYGSYARILSAAIRSSLNGRHADKIRAGIAEDGAGKMFVDLASDAPSANEPACDRMTEFVRLFEELTDEGRETIMAKLVEALREQEAEEASHARG